MSDRAVAHTAALMFVEQYFYPDGWGGAQIPRDITAALRRAGFAVDVLCGRDQYAAISAAEAGEDPVRLGIRILRVPRILPGGVHRLKGLRILWFCLCALPRLLLQRRVALFITQTNPALIVPAVALAARLRGKPYVVIAQDLYPEVLFAAGVSVPHRFVARVLRTVFNWAYARAARVVILGDCMRQRVLAKGVVSERTVIIPNWATGDLSPPVRALNPLRREWGLEGRFVLLYSGNIGIGHEFETVLRGLQLAVAAGTTAHAVIVGAGARLGQLRARVRELALTAHVTFKDFVPAHDLPLTLGLADLALVTLRPGFEGVIVPSKLVGYMARGVPVLYVGPPSDISTLLGAAQCGAWVHPGEFAACSELLRRAVAQPKELQRWGENGLRYYSAQLAAEHGLRRYVELVGQCLPASAPQDTP